MRRRGRREEAGPPPPAPWVEEWTDADERALLDREALERLAGQRYGEAFAWWVANAAHPPLAPGDVVATRAECGPIEPPSLDHLARRSHTLNGQATWRDGRPA